MINRRDKEKFLDALRELSNISVACKRANIAKATIYRWRAANEAFNEEVLEALEWGRDSVNDLAKSVVVSNMKKGSMRAAQFWLENNDPTYYKPRPVQAREEEAQPITQFNISLISDRSKNSEIENFSGSTEQSSEKKE